MPRYKVTFNIECYMDDTIHAASEEAVRQEFAARNLDSFPNLDMMYIDFETAKIDEIELFDDDDEA